MKIVADENIPAVESYFKNASELILKPGRDITRNDLLTADFLLVRSVTNVNEKLLAGTSVKFVGSSATGIDHLDTQWMDKAGIKWFAAEGCNTQAVVEYVVAVVAALKKQNVFPDRQLRAGVIGVGKVGSLVAKWLDLLGFEVILCDPPRAARENNFSSVSLADFKNLDFITVHVPLTSGGKDATHHLINKDFLLRQQKGCVLVNTSRGAVIDSRELQEYGEHLYWCLDVWENEPYINFEMLNLSEIATPHIAGYSIESKMRGIEMVYQAMMGEAIVRPMNFQSKELNFENIKVDWFDVILKMFDPYQMTAVMKKKLVEDDSGTVFDLMRKNFNDRHEFAAFNVKNLVISDADKKLLVGLGVALGD